MILVARLLRIALLFVVGSVAMGFQTAGTATRLAFEVQSVKPTNITNGSITMGSFPGGFFRAANISLRMLLKEAYRIQDYQIVGAPDWLDSFRFDITAKAADTNATRDDVHLMLQSLMESSFSLKFHYAEKEVPVYALIVGKGGSKLQDVSEGAPGPNKDKKGPMAINKGQLITQKAPITQIAGALSNFLGRPVLDKTGLDGLYNIRLTWTPDPVLGSTSESTDPTGFSIFTAIQDQLGLKLESRKGPVESFVIDTATKPPQN